MQSRREERLLNRVLGGVEVAIPPDERAEDLRRQLPQQVLDTRRLAQVCRNASISAALDGAWFITSRT